MKKTLLLALCIASFLAAAATASAQSAWVGTTSDFFTGSNWLPSGVPSGVTADITFGNATGGNYSVNFDSGATGPNVGNVTFSNSNTTNAYSLFTNTTGGNSGLKIGASKTLTVEATSLVHSIDRLQDNPNNSFTVDIQGASTVFNVTENFRTDQSFTKSGAGRLNITGTATNSGAGTLTISGGTLNLVGGSFGNGGNQAAFLGLISSAGTDLTNNGVTERIIQVGASSGGAATSTASGDITGNLRFVYGYSTASNPRTQVLAGNNTYTGTTTVNSGTLVVGSNTALGNATSEVVLGVAGANYDASLLIGGAFTLGRDIRTPTSNTSDAGTRVLTLGGNTADNSTFSGNIILGTASQAGRGVTLTAASGGQVTFSGVIQDPTSMDATTYTVTKSGQGTVVLSNNNTFTGATTVGNGTLKLANSSAEALSSTSGITVNSTGTLLLSQSNQVKNSATMSLGGGKIQFGAAVAEGSSSAVGVGALTLTANSTLDFAGFAGTITFASGFSPGTFTLAVTNWVSGSHLYFNESESANLSSFTVNGLAAQQFFTGSFYEIVAVPEPGTIAAGLSLLAFLAVRERKRLASLVRVSRHIGKKI